jgi:hypothetical protein
LHADRHAKIKFVLPIVAIFLAGCSSLGSVNACASCPFEHYVRFAATTLAVSNMKLPSGSIAKWFRTRSGIFAISAWMAAAKTPRRQYAGDEGRIIDGNTLLSLALLSGMGGRSPGLLVLGARSAIVGAGEG